MDVTQEERMKAYLMGWAYRKGENMRKGLPDDGVTYQQIELAYYMGLATRKGEEMRLAEMAIDEALADEEYPRWVTIHPNGPGDNRRIRIEKDGTIVAGLSKAHVGKKISEIGEVFRKTKTGGKTETVTETKTETKTETAGKELSRKIKPLVGHKTAEETKAQLEEKLRGQVQNRDRSSAASVKQMKEIAKNPDWDMLGASKSFIEGSPVVALGDVPDEQLGKTSVIVDAKHKKIEVQYAVMEADQVMATNNADGSSNAAYYDTEKPGMRTIAGNGRMAGVQEAYRQGNADEYKEGLIREAEDLKLDPEVVKGMKNPVLVRVMKPEDVTSDIGERTNTAATLTLSNTERADTDNNRLGDWKPKIDDEGMVEVSSIRDFVQTLSPSERGQYIDKAGNVNRQAEERMQMALFRKAYENDDDLFNKAWEETTDHSTKKVITALKDAAPALSNLADLPNGYDARAVINAGIHKFIDQQAGKSIAGQHDMFLETKDKDGNAIADEIAAGLARNKRSASGQAEFLTEISKALHHEATRGQTQSEDLFAAFGGGRPTYSALEVIKQANEGKYAYDASFGMTGNKKAVWESEWGLAFIRAVANKKNLANSPAVQKFFRLLNAA